MPSFMDCDAPAEMIVHDASIERSHRNDRWRPSRPAICQPTSPKAVHGQIWGFCPPPRGKGAAAAEARLIGDLTDKGEKR
jgi:hypothetical protein